MAELLTIDESEIIGGPAMMMLAPHSYPMPGRITEVLSLSTYQPNGTYGFLPIGATEIGVTMAREVSTKNWTTDQQGLLKIQPLDYKSVITTRAMQTSQENKERLQQASAGVANGAGELVTYFEASPFLSIWRVAIIHQDEFGKFHARVFPHVQWDGKSQKELFERGSADTIDFSLEAYPSTDAVGPNGYASDRVDFDQP